MAEEQVKDFVQKNLDKIDWETLNKEVGITRKAVEADFRIARQLAEGKMTDLVQGNKPTISGPFSLRAFYDKATGTTKVFAYTIEPKKSVDKAFSFVRDKEGHIVEDEDGQPKKKPNYQISNLSAGHYITSESAIKNLLEVTTWEGSDGKKMTGLANANAGKSIKVEWTERKEVLNEDGTPKLDENGKKTYELERKYDYYLVSFHQPTQRFIGMPTRAVKAILLNEDGTAKQKSMYNKEFTAEQLTKLANGEHVFMKGCKDSKGNTFSCFVQFSVTDRQIVPVHPSMAKKLAQSGVDLEQKETAAKKQAPAKEVKKTAPKTEVKAAPKEEKKTTAKIKVSR